jgi:hypothetical protein
MGKRQAMGSAMALAMRLNVMAKFYFSFVRRRSIGT